MSIYPQHPKAAHMADATHHVQRAESQPPSFRTVDARISENTSSTARHPAGPVVTEVNMQNAAVPNRSQRQPEPEDEREESKGESAGSKHIRLLTSIFHFCELIGIARNIRGMGRSSNWSIGAGRLPYVPRPR